MSKQETVMGGTTEKSSKHNSISRRDFLKLSATVGSVAAISDFTLGGPIKTLVEGAKPQATVQDDVWVQTSCDVCDQRCGLLIHRLNGVVVKVEGDPRHPLNKGKTCARPQGYPMYVYNPYRIKAPLKRTNPQKGLGVDPKWVEISWDEALSTIADKLKTIRAKDPHRYWSRHGGHRDVTSTVASAFDSAYGSVNGLGSVNFCTGGANHMSATYYFGTHTAHPYNDYQKYFIEIGGRLWGAKGSPEVTRYANQLKANGTHLVNLGPMIPPCSAQPDEWLPIKPGTDAALDLAMSYVMVHELGTFDVDFVKRRTNLPYLIRPDGQYMRGDGPLVTDSRRLNQKLGPPLIWDPVDKKAKAFNDSTFKDYALEGTYVVNGFECKPAFQLLKDHLAQYTPEYAEKITTIPANTIRRITNEFLDAVKIGSTIVIDGITMRLRPATFGYSKSYSGSRGWHTQSANKIPAILTGGLNCPGTWGAGDARMPANPADGVAQIDEFYYGYKFPETGGIQYPSERMDNQDLYPIIYNTTTLSFFATADPKKYNLQHPCEAHFFCGSNFLGDSFNRNFIAEQMAKWGFIWGMPYHLDDVAQMADILVPISTHIDGLLREQRMTPYCRFEEPYYFVIKGGWIQQPSIPPVYDTRNPEDVFTDLAERVGILYGKGGVNDVLNGGARGGLAAPYKLDLNKKYSWSDIFDRILKSEYGDQYGLDYMMKNGFCIAPQDSKPSMLYHDQDYAKTRYRAYVEEYVWLKPLYAAALNNIKQKFGYEMSPSNDFILNYYQPLPSWIPRPYEDPKLVPAEYDMYAVHYKEMTFASMTTYMDNPWFAEYTELFDPYAMMILINADTAKKKGIADGDSINVESPFGKITTLAKTSELIRPDTVAIGGCFGSTSTDINPHSRLGALFNDLCWADENFRDPICGNQENGMKVKVYKA